MSLIKSFLNYFFVTFLRQRIDSFEILTSTKKIVAITSLRFSHTFRDFEIFLRLIKWLRLSISYYAQRSLTLQERKTSLTKNISKNDIRSTRKKTTIKTRYDLSNEEQKVFRDIKLIFEFFTFFIHFNKIRRLYIDLNAFKKWDFVVMIYHVQENFANDKVTFSRISMQFIMFFNKCLNEVEKNYWLTKLKIAKIVWVMRKIKHMIKIIECFSIIIYTNYSATMSISRQINLTISNIDKLNLRLIRASQYLFEFNLNVRHKSNKFNVVSDVLLRLKKIDVFQKEKIEILKFFYDVFIELCEEDVIIVVFLSSVLWIYNMTLMKLTNEFKKRLKQTYEIDEHWKKILQLIKRDDTSTQIEAEKDSDFDTKKSRNTFKELRFQCHNELLYYIAKQNRHRLCILNLLKKKDFRINTWSNTS